MDSFSAMPTDTVLSTACPGCCVVDCGKTALTVGVSLEYEKAGLGEVRLVEKAFSCVRVTADSSRTLFLTLVFRVTGKLVA